MSGSSLGDMVVSFSADISNLSSGIQQAQNKVSGFEKDTQHKATGLSGAFTGLLGGVGSFAGKIGSLAGDALGLVTNTAGEAFGFLKDQLVESVHIAMAHQLVMTQTAQAIKSTGDASGMSAQQISGMADSLSQVTPFAEDTIQSGENLLLTFTGIGKKTFPAATQAMLDMATAMHQGPQQGAIMLGKALNDPLTGLSALQRVGVTFSSSEKEQIKTMMAHNDIIGAQGVMLKELNTEFGGSAKAAGTTFAGAMSILSNKFDDFKQKVGTAVLPILGQLVGFISSAVTPVLDTVSNALESPGFQSFVSGVGKGLTTVFQDIGDAATYVWNILRTVDLTDFTDAWHSVESTIKPLISDFSNLGSMFSTVGTDADPLAQVIGNLATGGLKVVSGLMWDLYVVLSNLDGLFHGGSADGLTSLIPAPFLSALSSVTGLFKTLGGVWNSDIKPGIASLLPVFKSFGDTLKTSVVSGVEQVSKIFSGQFAANMKFVGQEAQNLGKWFKSDLAPALAQAEPGFAKLASVILTTVVPGLAQLWAIGQQVARHIIADFLPVFEKAYPVLVRISGIVANGLGGALKFLMPYAIQAGQAIGTFAEEIADRVVPILMNFWNSISVGLDWLQSHWGSIWPGLSTTLKGIWDVISGIVQVAWALVSGIIKIGLDMMSGHWSAVWNDVKDMLGGVWNGIKSILKGAVGEVVGIFQFLYDMLIGHSIIPDLVNGIVSWFEQLIPRAMSAVSSVVGQIGSAFSGLASAAVSWGANLIGGLIAGIQNGIGGIGNVMSSVVNTIGSWLPHSPAKQGELSHLNEYGPSLIRGFSEGITKSKPMLEAALNMTIAPVKAAVSYPASSSSYPSAASYPSSAGGSSHVEVLKAIHNLASALENHQTVLAVDGNVLGHAVVHTMKMRKGIRS